MNHDNGTNDSTGGEADEVEDHASAFSGSGFNAARWSNDDLPEPAVPVEDVFGDTSEEEPVDGGPLSGGNPLTDEPAAEAQGDGSSGEGVVVDWDAPSEDWMPEPTPGFVDADDTGLPEADLAPADLHADLAPAPSPVAPSRSEPSQPRAPAAAEAPPAAAPASLAETPAASQVAEPQLGAAAASAGAAPPSDGGGEYPSFDLPAAAPSLREDGGSRRNGGRITPHDLSAEKSVLGALLLTPDRLVEVSEICKPDDFFDRRNRIVFECMLKLDERSQIVDGVTLIATLRATKTLGEIGGVSYLAEVSSSVSTSAHVKHHASLVAQTSKLRGLIDASNGIIETAFETAPEPEEVQTLIDQSEAAIFAIASKGEARGATGVDSILDEVFHSIEAQKDRGEFTGIPSGFYELDDMLGGFNPGEMTVIAARPAMGKTAFVLNIMDHAATNQAASLGYAPSVLFFSLEMGRASIVQRMLVARAGVEAHRLRSGRLHDREYADLVEAAGVLKNARLFIDDTPGLSIMALRSRARRLKAEHGLDMIVIDYLQLLSAKAESRQQEISIISRSLKEISRELEVPLLTLAQLSRSVESRENKRPQLSDLRESGSIEQDADVVMMLYREEYYSPTDENKGKAEAIVVKHRNGATGDIGLQFTGAMLRFSNREPSMAEPITGL